MQEQIATSLSGKACFPRHSLSGSIKFALREEEWRAIAYTLELSGREFQIVKSLFVGQKEAAIAHELAISVHTVHTHIKRLYNKLGVGDRVQLLLRVFEAYLKSRKSGS